MLLVSINAGAIQVPESCVESKKTPCLLKVFENQIEKTNDFKVVSQEESLFKIIQFEPTLSIEVIKGHFKIDSTNEIIIDGYKTSSKSWSYVQKENLDYKILNSVDLEVLTLGLDYKNKSTQYVLIKKDFLDKKMFLSYVKSYYKDNAEFKKDFSILSEKYKQKLEQDVTLQTAKIQEKIDRQIASEKAQADLKEKRRVQIEADRKKYHQMFFMRTFEE